VNPEFDAFWKEHEFLLKLELVIPEVVKGELLFQQTSSAFKSLEKAAENIRDISSITARTHKLKLSRETVRKLIEQKLDKWVKSKRAKIVKIPINSINWRKFCDDAIWRKPPFLFEPRSPDIEKGFRDTLILETLVDFVRNESRNVIIVFICNDDLLRTTAENRLGNCKHCSFYENLPDFSSYIKLTKEKLTKEFIKAILSRAKEKFFLSKYLSCLYYKEKLTNKILSDYKDKFEIPDDSPSSALPFLGKGRSWEQSDSGRWWIYNPEFEKLVRTREYHWKSILLFVQSYKRMSKPSLAFADLLLRSIEPSEKVLFLRFAVYWKANVTANGRFYDVALEKIEHLTKTFRVPTDEEIRSFQLQKETS